MKNRNLHNNALGFLSISGCLWKPVHCRVVIRPARVLSVANWVDLVWTDDQKTVVIHSKRYEYNQLPMKSAWQNEGQMMYATRPINMSDKVLATENTMWIVIPVKSMRPESRECIYELPRYKRMKMRPAAQRSERGMCELRIGEIHNLLAWKRKSHDDHRSHVEVIEFYLERRTNRIRGWYSLVTRADDEQTRKVAKARRQDDINPTSEYRKRDRPSDTLRATPKTRVVWTRRCPRVCLKI
jgi:hypothetical protein